MMRIRKASISDIVDILQIIEDARLLMKDLNIKQWTKEANYPGYEDFYNDIKNDSLYVLDNNNQICGMFALVVGIDPNYKIIKGIFINDDNKYSTIHRLALKKEYYHKGLTKIIFDFCINYNLNHNITSLRSDTHLFNIPMNNALSKYGFTRCGIINILDCLEEPERYVYEIMTKKK